jgi:hypothetical protein
MALQTSGAISLDNIHVEAGGSSSTSATINDTDIRGLIGKSSGASNSFNEYYGASSGPTTSPAFGPFSTSPEIQFAWGAAEGYASNSNSSSLAPNTQRDFNIAAYGAAYTGNMNQRAGTASSTFGTNGKGQRFLQVTTDCDFTNSISTNIWNGQAIQNNGGYTIWGVMNRPNNVGSGYIRPFNIVGTNYGAGITSASGTSIYTGNTRHYSGINLYLYSSQYWVFQRGSYYFATASGAYLFTQMAAIASPYGTNYQTFFIISVAANTNGTTGNGGRARIKTRINQSSGSTVDNATWPMTGSTSSSLYGWTNSTLQYKPNLIPDGAKFWFADSAYHTSYSATMHNWYEFGFANRMWTATEQNDFMTYLEAKYGY